MFAVGFFEVPASLLAWFYSFTHNYAVAVGLIAVVVMILITPLTLKSTKGMLEMQRLAPQMRKLQAEYRNDRQKLNEEMMKLYQEHKVNPMASCLPLLAQMPVFIIMFRIMIGLTYTPSGAQDVIGRSVVAAGEDPQAAVIGGGAAAGELGFLPRFISTDSEMFTSLARQTEMSTFFNFDLSRSAFQALGEGISTGLPYVFLVVILGCLYFFQQRMVAARAAMSPTMSPAQQKLMQYLPVFFAVFQVIFLAALVIYYIAQAILRILQQAYITRRFYGHDESLGRQAQRASEEARELAKKDGGGGLFAQARQQLGEGRGGDNGDTSEPKTAASSTKPKGGSKSSEKSSEKPSSKRTTPPKQRPTPSAQRASNRPRSRGGSQRPKSGAKRRR